MKLMRHIPFLILFSFSSCWVYADDPDPGLVQLQSAINQLEQAQQSLYQQFLMTQELRKNAFQDLNPLNTRSLNYDENVRLQCEAVEKLERYDRDLGQAYAHLLEIGDQKKMLLDQMMELTQPANP